MNYALYSERLERGSWKLLAWRNE